jgi:hypothetical protein
MPNLVQLRALSKGRLRDAEALFKQKRYQGSYYLRGYAVELALKSRICSHLGWNEYKTGNEYKSLKIHDLDVLLEFSGCVGVLKQNPKNFTVWSVVNKWRPEVRYDPLGKTSRQDAANMILQTKMILKILWKH